jgi:hypothetical protein
MSRHKSPAHAAVLDSPISQPSTRAIKDDRYWVFRLGDEAPADRKNQRNRMRTLENNRSGTP